LQEGRIAAFGELVADVATGAYPAPQHVVSIDDDEYAQFIARIGR